MNSEAGWNDRQLDQVLGNLLRVGVLLAAAVVLLGAALYLARHAEQPIESYQEFHGQDSPWRSLGSIVSEASSFSGRGIIQLGVLILIATPIARVMFSVVAFLLQRDYIYVIVTLIVLSALMYSLLYET